MTVVIACASPQSAKLATLYNPTLIGRTGPMPCSASGADCAQACEHGNGWACTLAADRSRAQHLPDERNLYVQACILHDPDGCAQLTIDEVRGGGGRVSGQNVEETLRDACVKFQSKRACDGIWVVRLADDTFHEYDQKRAREYGHPTGDTSPFQAYLTAMNDTLCESFGSAEACHAVEKWDRACALGDNGACTTAKDIAAAAAKQAYDESPEGKAKAAEEALAKQQAEEVAKRAYDATPEGKRKAAEEAERIAARQAETRAWAEQHAAAVKAEEERAAKAQPKHVGTTVGVSDLVIAREAYAKSIGKHRIDNWFNAHGHAWAVDYANTASWTMYPDVDQNVQYVLVILVPSTVLKPTATLTTIDDKREVESIPFVIDKALDGKWYALSAGVKLWWDPNQAKFWEVTVHYSAGSDEPSILAMFPGPL